MLFPVMVALLIRPIAAVGESPVAHEPTEAARIGDRTTIKPFVEFYSIGSLFPHSNAGRFIYYEAELEAWRRLIGPELARIAKQQGNARAADALLVLACGKWLFDQDADGAVETAKAVIKQFPSAATILSANPYDLICPLRPNPELYFYLRDLVKGTVRSEKGLSRREVNDLRDRDGYVRHMLDYPDLCADAASMLIYGIATEQKDYRTAEAMLKGILQRHPYRAMKRTKANDKGALAKAGGRTLEESYRPEIIAGLYLALYYHGMGDMKRACEFGREFADAVSPDGYYWAINRSIGDILLSNADARQDAERQYRLALGGYLEYVGREAERAKADERRLPLETWKGTIVGLKKQIQKAGGKISVDSMEIEYLSAPSTPKEEGVPLKMDSILKRLKDVHDKQGNLSSPAGRQAAVEQIAEAVRQKRAGAAAAKKLELTPKETASIAVKLAHLAGEERDVETRRIMLGNMKEIAAITQAAKPARGVSQDDRRKVDRLVGQINGETGIEGAVPDPQADLADMDAPALLYAAGRVEQGALPLQTRRAVTKALANSENPALFQFFVGLAQRAEDEKLTWFAVRGIERIVAKTAAGGEGMAGQSGAK